MLAADDTVLAAYEPAGGTDQLINNRKLWLSIYYENSAMMMYQMKLL